jgi:hypothetical protein
MITRIDTGTFNGINHTIVFFDNGAYICSCGQSSEVANFFFKPIPNLRLENKCAVCGKPAGQIIVGLDDSLCGSCHDDYDAWSDLNPELPAMDFLREKLREKLPTHIEDYYNGY